MTGASKRLRVAAFIRIRAFRAMYYACRVDYPCEGCEMGRWASFRSALGWARRLR